MLRLNPTSAARRGMVQCCWLRHGRRASNFDEETESLFRPGIADRCGHDWLAVPTPETDCAGGQMGPDERLDLPQGIAQLVRCA